MGLGVDDDQGPGHIMEAQMILGPKGLGLGWSVQRGWKEGCPRQAILRTMIAQES